ncbi:MAG: hypothetical protein AMXMBFR31_03420 [Candidatus Desulfobacillus denitrificans]
MRLRLQGNHGAVGKAQLGAPPTGVNGLARLHLRPPGQWPPHAIGLYDGHVAYRKIDLRRTGGKSVSAE